MKNINKKGVIYIYVILLVGVLITNILFISEYIYSNIENYNSIKNYYTIYGYNKGLDEEIIVNYFDNSKNIHYIDTKYFDKNNFVSRYKDFIEYFLDEGEFYELSLTTQDEEYNNNLNNLKYIDLYWNNSINKCDFNISFLKWEKKDINTIINNKNLLKYIDNRSLLYAVKQKGFENIINVYFSTGVYYNNSNLIKQNFLLNNNTISTLSGSIGSKEYNLVLNKNIDNSVINILNINGDDVKDINGNKFVSDDIVLKNEKKIYTNRYRIKDGFGEIDKLNYEYKILFIASNSCTFLLQGLDKYGNIVKLPSNKLEGNFNIGKSNTKLSINKDFKIGNIKLSNYLYKLY